MIHPCPKPRKRAKRKPKGLTRTRMKQHPNRVVRDRERMAFCASLPCVVCLVHQIRQRSRTHAHHLKTRGAGGKETGNLVPLCAGHHDEFHREGRRTFEAMYAPLDLGRAAHDVEYLFRVQLGTKEAA